LKSVDRQTVVGAVFTMLLAGVTCLKHEGFAEEREWRAIYSPRRLPSPLVESSTEVVNGIPQIVHKIPLDAGVSPVLAELDLSRMFDRLIIGPSQYPLAMYEAFTQVLKAAGVADAEHRVLISGIPIRTFLARVARVWKISRASVYRSLKETPPNTSARRPGFPIK
jgi:hypothetical protein